MHLAWIASENNDANGLLYGLAETLAARGLRLAGTVQINSLRPDACKCDMDVKVLPDGPVIRISQDLGPQSQGCRLTPDTLEQAVAESTRMLATGADVLIVNKFGKQEAEGRGFRELIGEALARDIPVIVAVNALSRPAFETFADGLATALPGDAGPILDWVLDACAPGPRAASAP